MSPGIEYVRGWEDPGFTEGAIEVPSLDYALPTPRISVGNGYYPQKGDLFRKVRLEGAYLEWFDINYISLRFSTNHFSGARTFYAWVDNITLLSDDPESPMIEIEYHLDYWKTFLPYVTFGYGMVRRKPRDEGEYPPQDYPFRYREFVAENPIPLIPNQTLHYFTDEYIHWLVVNYTQVYTVGDSPEEFTNIGKIAIPFRRDGTTLYMRTADGTVIESLDGWSMCNGFLDEYLRISPERVINAYLSPIQPNNVYGTGTQDSPFYTEPDPFGNDKDVHWLVRTTAVGGFFMFRNTFGERFHQAWTNVAISLDTSVMSDDERTWYLTDPYKNVIAALPWGLKVQHGFMCIYDADSTAYLRISLRDTGSFVEGMVFDMPLPAVPLTSNSWAEYVYSGAKEYDAESKRIANQRAMWEGSLSGITQGASAGTAVGLMNQGPNALGIGAGVGLTTMALAPVSSLANYAVSEFYTDRLLEVTEQQKSNQTDHILAYGDDILYYLRYGQLPALSATDIDDYSSRQRNQDINLNGYHVSEPKLSCDYIRTSTGPYKVDNLIVRGAAPNAAKQYIKSRLAAGVRLIV